MKSGFRGKSSRVTRRSDEAGFVSVEIAVAFAFSMILLVAITNVLLMQYGRAVLRAAADESVRVGARMASGTSTDATQNAADRCLQRQADVLKGLGKLGKVTNATCDVVNGQVRSSVSAEFHPWAPIVPTFTDTATALSVKEEAPQ